MIPHDTYRFREKVLDALGTREGQFWYVDADNCVAICPVCGGALGVRFHGTAERVDLWCRIGCTEDQVGEAIREAIRKGATR